MSKKAKNQKNTRRGGPAPRKPLNTKTGFNKLDKMINKAGVDAPHENMIKVNLAK